LVPAVPPTLKNAVLAFRYIKSLGFLFNYIVLQKFTFTKDFEFIKSFDLQVSLSFGLIWWVCYHLKVESAVVAVLAICIFLSFYFAFLSFQAMDDALKKQLVTLAASSIITGVIILACMTIYLGIKKAFSSVEDMLRGSEEQ